MEAVAIEVLEDVLGRCTHGVQPLSATMLKKGMWIMASSSC
ncbi:Uncharacterised protein [Mycobacteroides abscessus subsp. abscessus]|nr:Uncharacterised protein [Mycobacteroides abscessus subsp. abscessus]